MEEQTKNKKLKTNSTSVIYLMGGKYDKKIFNKSIESTLWANEVIKLKTEGLPGSFADYRNTAAKMAAGKWLLYIDTDEIVTPGLKEAILKHTMSPQYSAYAIPRRNFIFGREMKHCGLYPDFVLRLIRKQDLVEWVGELHEQPKVKGEIFHLDEALLHYKHDNLTDMVEKTNEWSEIEGRLMFEAGHPKMNFIRFFTAGFREFWKRMVLQMAFLDGTRGVIYGLYQVFSRLISYTKLWELQLKKENARSNL